MKGNIFFYSAILLISAGCGGSQEPAHSPDEVDPPEVQEPKAEKVDEGGGEAKPDDEAGAKKDEGAAVAEPVFKDDMSVDEAINAVPQGTPRVNVDQETLGRPLMDEGLYKPCKMSPAQRLKLRVAVWEGKAVGIDVVATPKNEKVVSCVKAQIKAITWKSSVKSLNTVDYQF